MTRRFSTARFFAPGERGTHTSPVIWARYFGHDTLGQVLRNCRERTAALHARSRLIRPAVPGPLHVLSQGDLAYASARSPEFAAPRCFPAVSGPQYLAQSIGPASSGSRDGKNSQRIRTTPKFARYGFYPQTSEPYGVHVPTVRGSGRKCEHFRERF